MPDQPDESAAPAARCPFPHAKSYPSGGMPLAPAAEWAQLRDGGAAATYTYPDGHDGLLVTRYDLARAVLSDSRFSQMPRRFALEPLVAEDAGADDHELDEAAQASLGASDLLALDEPHHARIRRSVTSRFSVRSVKGYAEPVRALYKEQLARLLELAPPVDVHEYFSVPVSARVHCLVLGVPEQFVDRFFALFVGESSFQQRFDFIRDVFAEKRAHPGEDVISDLIASELSETEAEGAAFVLLTSGRDSVAYAITTATHALLSHPDQLEKLRADPSLMSGAVEEFMRFGSMFVTLFPRTATEDLLLEGVEIRKGQTVSVSPVAANRDERQFGDPDVFDITRDAFGHLAFSHGPHGCVGQQLARLQIREAVGLLIGIPGLALVRADQAEPQPYASHLPTYEAGSLLVEWAEATAS